MSEDVRLLEAAGVGLIAELRALRRELRDLKPVLAQVARAHGVFAPDNGSGRPAGDGLPGILGDCRILAGEAAQTLRQVAVHLGPED